MKTKKRKRLMTEREAWLFLARGFTAASRAKPWLMIGPFSRGICYAAVRSSDDKLFTRSIADAVFGVIRKHDAEMCDKTRFFPYWFHFTRSGAKKRAALCRKFAKECKR